jgi:hypothetical protein
VDRVWLATPGGTVLMHTLPLGEYIERQWTDGVLTRVNEDGSAYVGDPFDVSGDGAEVESTATGETGNGEPVRPAQAAPKAEWVAYVVALGVTDEETAKGMTKADLVTAATPPEMTADQGE